MLSFLFGCGIATGIACLVSEEFKTKVGDCIKAGKDKVCETLEKICKKKR